MNGAANPNADRMAGFGKGKNYMQAGKDGGVKMDDILPKDPYSQDNSRAGKWIKESEQKHEQKQAEIAAEQQQFVPESFKKSGAMNLDIKGNKSQGAQKTWLDNTAPAQSQQAPSQSPPNNNQPNNFPFNNRINMQPNQQQNQQHNAKPQQRPNQRPPQQQQQQQQQRQRQQKQQQNAPNMHMNQKPNQSQPHQQQPPPQKPMNNNNNNNGSNMNAALNRPQGPIDQPIPQPYYNQKPDPFAKYVNNSQYQRDLKDHGHGGKQKGGYAEMNKANYRPYNHNAQNSKQQDENTSVYHTGNKESQNWSGVDNQFSQPIRSVCTACGKAVQESWTEDSKQRIYHNECFACIVCHTPLGQLGKYVTVGDGVMCKQCRSQQMQEQHPHQY